MIIHICIFQHLKITLSGETPCRFTSLLFMIFITIRLDSHVKEIDSKINSIYRSDGNPSIIFILRYMQYDLLSNRKIIGYQKNNTVNFLSFRLTLQPINCQKQTLIKRYGIFYTALLEIDSCLVLLRVRLLNARSPLLTYM